MTHSPLPVYSPHINRPIDNTALDAYMRCEWLHFVSMILHRRKGGLTKPALAYGTCWHKILETHYKTGGNEELVRASATLSWQEHDNPDDHRTLERCLSEYYRYIQRWGDHDAEAVGWGSTVGYPDAPMVEIATELTWPGARHPYTGKIDRIVEHQGLYYVEDHKTTSALGATYFRQFDPSNQMMGYAWLAQHLTGLPIAGVRINAHGVLKTQGKFERQTVMFSPERLQEWAENYNRWIEMLEVSYAAVEGIADLDHLADPIIAQAFPRNFNACAGKYGPCTYTDVCTMPARLRARVLEADFEYNPWNPLEAPDDAAE